jgi:hypothetical protein
MCKTHPVQVKIKRARITGGGGLFPSGGWNNSSFFFSTVFTSRKTTAAKAKPINGEKVMPYRLLELDPYQHSNHSLMTISNSSQQHPKLIQSWYVN